MPRSLTGGYIHADYTVKRSYHSMHGTEQYGVTDHFAFLWQRPPTDTGRTEKSLAIKVKFLTVHYFSEFC
jgi:hypothetical protein